MPRMRAHGIALRTQYHTLLIISRVSDQPDLLFLLHDLARQLRTDADRRAAAHGMTRAQWMILFWLERQPGLSQKELAEILEVEPITVAVSSTGWRARHGRAAARTRRDRRIWRLHLLPAAQPGARRTRRASARTCTR